MWLSGKREAYIRKKRIFLVGAHPLILLYTENLPPTRAPSFYGSSAREKLIYQKKTIFLGGAHPHILLYSWNLPPTEAPLTLSLGRKFSSAESTLLCAACSLSLSHLVIFCRTARKVTNTETTYSDPTKYDITNQQKPEFQSGI
jgi:hypothetical protein